MKKKKEEIKELNLLTIDDLNKKIKSVREEMAKSRLEFSVNKPKDTNLIAKKKKLLAKLLTVVNDKKRKRKS